MRYLSGIVGACAIAMAVAGGHGALADVQKCVMGIGKTLQGDMIAPEIFLIYDDAAKTLQVMDNVIAYFNKDKPVQAKISAEKDVSRSFAWSVLMVNSGGQRTKMQYHATLFHAKRELQVLARPVGFNNTFSAVGTCAPYNG